MLRAQMSRLVALAVGFVMIVVVPLATKENVRTHTYVDRVADRPTQVVR